MTTLQESAMRLALAALTSTDALPYENWMRASGHPAIKALNAALAQQELPQKERPDFLAGYDAGMADAKRMAQQREPVAQARLGMKDGLAMALSVVELYGMKGDVIYREIAKLRDGIAAAPAPQAQQGEPVCHGCGIPAGDVHMSTCKSGKWPSRVSNGDTAAPAPQPEQGVGRTNPGDETGGAVERFGWQTFLGKSPKIIPATNGSFVWYSDYLKLWQSAQPEDGCAPNHMCNGHRVHIPTGECCNKCGATSW